MQEPTERDKEIVSEYMKRQYGENFTDYKIAEVSKARIMVAYMPPGYTGKPMFASIKKK